MNKTIVIFRKWPNGDIIALFPMEPGTANVDTCQSYEHVGQHGAASVSLTDAHTKPALPSEYYNLKRELESAPYFYRFEVRKRIPSNARKVRRAEVDRLTTKAISATTSHK